MEQAPTNQSIQVFMGYDHRAPIGYHVCAQSLMEKSSLPLSMTPLKLSNLTHVFTRERSPTQLCDFSHSRFLVPYLSGYEGWSLYMDGCIMLVRDDIAKLWALRDEQYAVMVVKRPDFKENEHTFMGTTIPTYPMFNWASVMLFNNKKCKSLTPESVNTSEHLFLHQFKWLENPLLIGALPPSWNHLVGYDGADENAKLVHWTLGAPYLGGEFANTEHAPEWFSLEKKITTLQESSFESDRKVG
jgi:hypothetical protein